VNLYVQYQSFIRFLDSQSNSKSTDIGVLVGLSLGLGLPLFLLIIFATFYHIYSFRPNQSHNTVVTTTKDRRRTHEQSRLSVWSKE